ncbi:MAG: hypothetical protein UR95_C0002G0091 [Parcubacteria group bacterium GW2011_GWC1_36_108]|nr:MAG: hypothetical protein UR95_C0002G0091 [Parcubacteria group bacterium GW2011_GWC1_36_108]HAS00254.1 hypothetical protein [Candidatus Moranbacteria bacterium]HBI50762.1 hypothetical protein [Candidatus Moranbacteria bacterium]HBU10833.1 hypothetical protein [Candidatus Moranbacteria bacterium]HCO99375.1 hypothetical protein [Candidatus Moranbacteria bacterium]
MKKIKKILNMDITQEIHINEESQLAALIALVPMLVFSFFFSTGLVSAAETTDLSQSITGALDVKIVDGSGNEVASPNVAFASKNFAATSQTSAAVLGTASEKMRVTNPRGNVATWSLNLAATSGATSSWSNGTNNYDFNDVTALAADGGDGDSIGGQLSIDPSAGTLAGVGTTSGANVSLGAASAFNEGTVDSIDILSAAAGAQKPGVWDLTGVNISQSIPGMQATGSYTINMTLTAI